VDGAFEEMCSDRLVEKFRSNPLGVIAMKELKISASKLTVAEECPYHFYLQYVKKLKVFTYTHPAAAAGTLFHKCAENWYAQARHGGALDLPSLLATVPGALKSVMGSWNFKLAPEESTPAKLDEMQVNVKALLESFYQDEVKRNSLVLPLWTEKEFGVSWDTGKGYAVVLNGFMDRVTVINGEAYITDYKTSSILNTQTHVDEMPQLTIYSAAYRWLAQRAIGGGLPPSERFVELYFPKFRVFVQSVRTKDHFDDLKNRLVKVAQMEISETKSATPSENACRFCQYAVSGDCKITPFCKKKS
jgi:RecB family exonuclease